MLHSCMEQTTYCVFFLSQYLWLCQKGWTFSLFFSQLKIQLLVEESDLKST